MGLDHRRRHRPGGRDPVVLLNLAVIAGAFLAYLGNELWLTPRIGGAFANGYLNDVLAGVLLLAWTNLLFALSPWRARRLTTVPRAIALLVAAGLFWELVTPLYRPSTTDLLDLVAYGSGGVLLALLPRFTIQRAR